MSVRISYGVLMLVDSELAYRRHRTVVEDDAATIGQEIITRNQWLSAFALWWDWCESVVSKEEMIVRDIVQGIFNGQ